MTTTAFIGDSCPTPPSLGVSRSLDKEKLNLQLLLAGASWDNNRFIGDSLPTPPQLGSQEILTRRNKTCDCSSQEPLATTTAFIAWDPNRVWVGQLSPINSVVVTRGFCAELLQVVASPRQNFLRPQLVWSWQAIPYKSCCCHKKLLRGAVAGFVSPCQYFLRLPTRVELGSYPLLNPLLSQEIPARSSRRFLYLLVHTSCDPNRGGFGQQSPIKAVVIARSSCEEQSQVFFLLVNTSWDSQPGLSWQLSPIKAVVVTRNSCAERSQVFVSPRQYFLWPQPGWIWAAIPYKSCCYRKKLLRGAVAGCCISSSKLLETPTWVELAGYPL